MNKVSFQGEYGAYSESAARKFFGEKIEAVPSKTFEDALKNTENDNSEYSILHVENSTPYVVSCYYIDISVFI